MPAPEAPSLEDLVETVEAAKNDEGVLVESIEVFWKFVHATARVNPAPAVPEVFTIGSDLYDALGKLPPRVVAKGLLKLPWSPPRTSFHA